MPESGCDYEVEEDEYSLTSEARALLEKEGLLQDIPIEMENDFAGVDEVVSYPRAIGPGPHGGLYQAVCSAEPG